MPEMYDGHRVGVVIPVYNEASFIGEVIDGLPAFVDRAYPVDDCSTDGTWSVIEQRSAVDRRERESAVESQEWERATMTDGSHVPETRIVPVRHETNRGRGGAVKTGYRAALDDGMDVIAVMDGDGQMNPDRLDALIDPVVSGVAEYAKGNRLGTKGLRDEMSTWRLFGNTLLTGLTRVASGYWGMTDPQSGFTAISREALESLDIDALYDDYGFLNDILVRLNVHDARIADVPVSAIYGEEESGIEYRSFVPLLSLLLASRFVWRLRSGYSPLDFHPVALLYGLAALSGIGGTMFALSSATSLPVTGFLVPLVVIAACPVLVVVAFLVERRYNRDLEFDLDSDYTLDDSA
ncbi:glycosyltransferase family 2 protein [Halobacteriales archaeon QS_4_62_28]|nr:MAG: glycosyltransferase family 2 protein [Halobacteriales archaeon QS_4_62_28]